MLSQLSAFSSPDPVDLESQWETEDGSADEDWDDDLDDDEEWDDDLDDDLDDDDDWDELGEDGDEDELV